MVSFSSTGGIIGSPWSIPVWIGRGIGCGWLSSGSAGTDAGTGAISGKGEVSMLAGSVSDGPVGSDGSVDPTFSAPSPALTIAIGAGPFAGVPKTSPVLMPSCPGISISTLGAVDVDVDVSVPSTMAGVSETMGLPVNIIAWIMLPSL